MSSVNSNGLSCLSSLICLLGLLGLPDWSGFHIRARKKGGGAGRGGRGEGGRAGSRRMMLQVEGEK